MTSPPPDGLREALAGLLEPNPDLESPRFGRRWERRGWLFLAAVLADQAALVFVSWPWLRWFGLFNVITGLCTGYGIARGRQEAADAIAFHERIEAKRRNVRAIMVRMSWRDN